MIRPLIGRVLRWFIDAADDADKLLRQKPLEHRDARPEMTTDGPVRKTGLYPDPAQLRKPADIPFRLR